MTHFADDLLALDEQRESLSPEEQEWLARALAHNLPLRSPADFAALSSHGLWVPYLHLRHTSDRIVAMIEQDACDLLIVEEPVRHGKTELCSRYTPAWYTIRYQQPVLLSSYEADFAATHGRRVRDLVGEFGPAFDVFVDDTSRAAHRWELRGGAGGMNTAGAGGPITGKGGMLLIIDDPIKNSEEANSPTVRQHLWEWWNSVFLTRRNKEGKGVANVIVIMSRWHEDEMIARILEHEAESNMRIERLRLPALAEDDDPLRSGPGAGVVPGALRRAGARRHPLRHRAGAVVGAVPAAAVAGRRGDVQAGGLPLLGGAGGGRAHLLPARRHPR